MTDVLSGLDLLQNNLDKYKNLRLGLLCHPSSVTKNYTHALDIFNQNGLNLTAIFTPQHGLWGHTQANMIEFESIAHPVYNVPVHSLYAENRKPRPEMLENIDILFIDLFDIGSRYYTYIWTMTLCLEACSENNKKVVILDRPNPLNGNNIEGPVLDMNYKSFVGLYSLPIRHGLTIGEIAQLVNVEYSINCELEVIKCENWARYMWFDETNLPWVMPSPNMPTLDTAIVYPGQCLLEGTNISEGRGTTRPFELFGAPFVNSKDLCKKLNEQNLPGAFFREVSFEPAFDKFKGELVHGCQIHVTERNIYKPFLTSMHILKKIHQLYPTQFELLPPPYEYEYEKLPMQILLGNTDCFNMLTSYNIFINEFCWSDDLNKYNSTRKKHLLYS